MSRTPTPPVPDPLSAWRDWFVKSEREWSESLTRMMKDETVARAMGQEVNAALYTQQMLAQGMAKQLATWNLPSRDDLVALGERMGRLEDAVARLEAALVQMRGSVAPDPARKPPRTRKAPAKGSGR
jgi:hypothetical protein